MALAVIKTGGKQYVVKLGQQFKIEKIEGEEGSTVKFADVLLVSDEKGEKVEIGQPLVKETVEATILEQGRARKLQVVKYKPKTRYHKVYGHRQPFTKVKITKIGSEELKVEKKVEKKAEKEETKPVAKKAPVAKKPAEKKPVAKKAPAAKK